MVAAAGEHRKFIEDALLQETDECILWPYGLVGDKTKYPGARIDGKSQRVHRYVCRRAHGDPPTEKHEAAHSCAKHICINKRHLRWATTSENREDMREAGNLPVGQAHGMSKLTEDQVLEIRSLNGSVSQRQLADRFGVDKSLIYMIFKRQIWRHI